MGSITVVVLLLGITVVAVPVVWAWGIIIDAGVDYRWRRQVGVGYDYRKGLGRIIYRWGWNREIRVEARRGRREAISAARAEDREKWRKS